MLHRGLVIHHRRRVLIASRHQSRFLFNLLILLHQVTARAAEGGQAVGQGIAVDFVLVPDFATSHALQEGGEAAAREDAPTAALQRRIISDMLDRKAKGLGGVIEDIEGRRF